MHPVPNLAWMDATCEDENAAQMYLQLEEIIQSLQPSYLQTTVQH